ncbi:MAG: hypothetical protein K1X64_16765 [Myxococcaceae bacterium]|nr:hypothetical protein [Myxococcaceae bacterium]
MDYSAYTVRELRKLAQEKWGSAAAQLKTKAELIAALKGLAPRDSPRPAAEAVDRGESALHGVRPAADWQWVEQRVVDHDFFVEAGQTKPGAGFDRVFAFNQDPSVIAISWQVTEQTLTHGVSLFMVGAEGKEQTCVQALTTREGFAVIDASVKGPSGRAQLRHTHSGAVLATSGDVSLPVRTVAASTATGAALEQPAPVAIFAQSAAAQIPPAASKRQASSW